MPSKVIQRDFSNTDKLDTLKFASKEANFNFKLALMREREAARNQGINEAIDACTSLGRECQEEYEKCNDRYAYIGLQFVLSLRKEIRNLISHDSDDYLQRHMKRKERAEAKKKALV